MKEGESIIKDRDLHVSKYNPVRVLVPYLRATHENEPKMADPSRRPAWRVASPGCFERG